MSAETLSQISFDEDKKIECWKLLNYSLGFLGKEHLKQDDNWLAILWETS